MAVRTPLPVYAVGTISGNAGSGVITGAGTNWTTVDANGNNVNVVMGGDVMVVGQQAIPIRSVDLATQVTLELPLANTINPGTAYRIIKYQANQSGGIIAALANVMAYGSDASPEPSLAVDNGAGRVKFRIGPAGTAQIAVGPTNTADAALATALEFSQDGTLTNTSVVGRNTIINGNFGINQRVVADGSSVTLSAGQYARDRWKAGSSGCTYSAAAAPNAVDTIVTITAGTMVQAIEGGNVASASVWITWAGTAPVRVWQGSASGVFSTGQQVMVGGIAVNRLLVTGLTPGTIANVECGTGSVSLVQAEAAVAGAGPSRFDRRLLGQELALCQRYYQKSYDPGIVPGYAMGNGACTVNANAPNGGCVADFPLPVSMRVTPSATLYDGTGSAGKVSYFNGSWVGGGTPSVIYPHPGRLFVQVNISGAYQINFDYALNSEI